MSLKSKIEQLHQVELSKSFSPEIYRNELVGVVRGENETSLMLELRLKGGKTRTLCYVDLREMEFDPSEGLQVYFSSLRFEMLIITVKGRNLHLVHEMLKQNKVIYLKEYPSENDPFEEEDVFIGSIDVEEVE